MPSSAPKKAARAALNRTQAILITAVLIAATLLMVLHSSVIENKGSSRLPTRFFAAASTNGAPGTKKSQSTSPAGNIESQTPPPGAAPLRGAVMQTPQHVANAGQRSAVSHARMTQPNFSWQSHPDRPSGLERTPSAFIPSPSWQEVLDARGRLAGQCALGDAWASQYWFTHRNESVAAQHTVRDALNLEGQYHVSRLGAASEAQLRPCRRTVVSIATIPSRIAHLHNLIRALREQDVPPDAILVALPPFAPRLRQAFTVPAFLADDPLVTIVHLPVDFGPLSKLAAAVYAEQDPDTCIMTVDDDNEPARHIIRTTLTWASLFPTAAIAECGWNVTCITGRVPFVCGEGYDAFLFVRQDWDTLCQPEHLPLYNFHECISPVDATHARATDVVMGVSNPLYRRGMFGEDFLDIAKIVAKRKVRAMLAAHYAASGEAPAPQDAGELAQDEGQLVRALALPLAVNSPAAQRSVSSSTHEPPAEQKANVLSRELLALGLAALRHPDLAETEHLLRWKRANPPDALFLVDDVYISAYLACKGVARLVVPSTPKARPPVPWARGAASALPPQPPRPAVDKHDGNLASVDALHGVAHFNLGNHEAVRFFHQEGCW